MMSYVFRRLQGHRKLVSQTKRSVHVWSNKIGFTVTGPSDMDGFGSDFSASGSGGKVDTGTIMEQVKVQIAVANAQELLQVIH